MYFIAQKNGWVGIKFLLGKTLSPAKNLVNEKYSTFKEKHTCTKTQSAKSR